jgi:hypothetical protein
VWSPPRPDAAMIRKRSGV